MMIQTETPVRDRRVVARSIEVSAEARHEMQPCLAASVASSAKREDAIFGWASAGAALIT